MKTLIMCAVIVAACGLANAGEADDIINSKINDIVDNKVYRFLKYEGMYSSAQIDSLLRLPRFPHIDCATGLIHEGPQLWISHDVLMAVAFNFKGKTYEQKILYDNTGAER